MMNYFLIGLGGAAGSMLRFFVSKWMHAFFETQLPVGTLAVNVVGSLAIGLLAGYFHQKHLPAAYGLLLVTGFLGGFTTFSAFSLENMMLVQTKGWLYALVYVSISVVTGLAAASAGYRLTTG